jgi:hypothetical protein
MPAPFLQALGNIGQGYNAYEEARRKELAQQEYKLQIQRERQAAQAAQMQNTDLSAMGNLMNMNAQPPTVPPGQASSPAPAPQMMNGPGALPPGGQPQGQQGLVPQMWGPQGQPAMPAGRPSAGPMPSPGINARQAPPLRPIGGPAGQGTAQGAMGAQQQTSGPPQGPQDVSSQVDQLVRATAQQMKQANPNLSPAELAHATFSYLNNASPLANRFSSEAKMELQFREKMASLDINHQKMVQQAETAQKRLEMENEYQSKKLDLQIEALTMKRESIQSKNASGGGFTPEMGELMASLAERGVSLPTGFRSKAQQSSLLEGLLSRNQGKSADEIAQMIKSGQISFGAEKKETQTAGATAGRIDVAANAIDAMIPVIKEASGKVPRGSFVPVNKLLQTGETSISDPNLKQLKLYINSLLNDYDMLASRGGTDQKKREEARALITSADGPEALNAALASFQKESEIAKKAAQKSIKGITNSEGSSGEDDPLGIR